MRSACLRAEQESVHCWNVIRKISERNYITAWITRIPPVLTEEAAPCQEVVHKATDPDFDLYKLVPAPTNTPVDAGPYITLGMCYASHPDTGVSDVTIHRLCIQGKVNYRSSLHRVHATSEQWQKEQKSLDSVCQSRSVSE